MCRLHTNAELRTNARNPLNVDPTRTTTLRRQFVAEMSRRFRELRKHLREWLVEEDELALKKKRLRDVDDLLAMRREFEFRQDAGKAEAFRDWLSTQMEADVLSPVGGEVGKPWTATYIESAYKRGQTNAYIASHEADYVGGSVGDQSQEAFLRSAFNAPTTTQKVALLSTRAFEDLKGVTAEMSTRMNRILAQGMLDGRGPATIAKEMSDQIVGLTRRRAHVIARTETIRAHAQGQLDTYRRLGVEELGVRVEWSTAGDDRVCPQCADMQGAVLSIEEARDQIPLHPQCRCSWIPSKRGAKITHRNPKPPPVATPVEPMAPTPTRPARSPRRRRAAPSASTTPRPAARPTAVPTETVRLAGTEFAQAGKFTKSELASIGEYQNGLYNSDVGGYTTITGHLRGNPIPDYLKKAGVTEKKIEAHIAEIDSAMAKSSLAKDTTLFRGVRQPELEFGVLKPGDLKPGLEYTASSYTSTSTSRNVIKRKFSDKLNRTDRPTLIRVNAKKGQSSLSPNLVHDPKEAEVLLPRGTRFRVTKVTGSTVDVEIIGRASAR